MCGITGSWNLETHEPIDRERLRAMNDVMEARGPDDEGSFVDGSFGMAARRLSIIDLAGGHQPIGNEDGRYWIAYNGEVYNFPELRDELIARGHVFRTRTDTETILHLYEEHGPSAVEKLIGMFAFAIYDRRERELFLARDRLGIKPLFWGLESGVFAFGSDVKSFQFLDAGFADEIDTEALHHYLSLNYIPAPYSIYRGVRSLPPGHTLTIDAGGRPRIERYWDVTYEPRERPIDEMAEELRALVEDSVRKRLIADVPVGVLLSGGIDSSSIASIMAAARGGPIETFSAVFDDESYSEGRYARAVAERIGSNHHEIEVGAPDADFIRQLAWDLGQPYADSSMIPLRHVCGLARRHVKVVLSGDGGDEVFAGYQTYTAHRLSSVYRRLPGFLREGLIRPLVEKLPTSDRKISFEYKAKRFVRAASLDPEVAHYEYKVLFDEIDKRGIFRPAARNGGMKSSYGVFDAAYRNGVVGDDSLHRLLYVDTKIYLPDDILVKVDRMSMAHSLEARVPLLDHRVVELAATFPSSVKQRGRTGKYIFKRAMADHLPPIVARRKKAGFNVPASRWLKGPLEEMVGDYLSESHVRETGLFEPREVAGVLDRHRKGLEDRSRELFGLLMFHVWFRHVRGGSTVRV